MDNIEKIRLGIKEYDPNDEVGVRGILTNQYGVKDDAIGWSDKGANGGTVTINGQNFMDIGEDKLKDGSSFGSAADVQKAIKGYESTYGYDFNAKSDPTKREYNSPYSENINALYQKIMDYDYDPDEDPTYDALKEKYTKAGNKAMTDTMSAASALTGGRLNSYAQTAGQGIYNDYMSELSGFIPELADKGLSRLYDIYNMSVDRDNTAYNRFNEERNFDTGVDQWDAEQVRLALQTQKDDERYEREWDYQEDRDAIADARYDKEWAYKVAQANKTGSGSKSTTNATPQQIASYEKWRDTFFGTGAGMYGEDRINILNDIALKETRLKDEVGEDLYNDLLDEARGYSPDSGIDYGSNMNDVMGALTGMSPDEIVKELSDNRGEYFSYLGEEQYNKLLDSYRGYAQDDFDNNLKMSDQKSEATENLQKQWDIQYDRVSEQYALDDPDDAMNDIINNEVRFKEQMGDENYQQLYDIFMRKAKGDQDRYLLKPWTWKKSSDEY